MRVVVGPVAEAHLMQQLPGSGLDVREDVFFVGSEIRALLGQKLAGQHHILEGRVLGKEVEGLKDQTEMEPFLPDLALPPGGRISGVEEDLVPDGDAPLVRRLQPEPEEPMMARAWPGSREKLMSRSTSVFPKALLICETSKIAISSPPYARK